jgi:hypothetical protein
MAIDRLGRTISEGHRVFNTYYREYGIIISIPNSGDFDFVEVEYLKKKEFTSPLELEIAIVQKPIIKVF